MPLPPPPIDSIPSPPLVPDDGPIDMTHLSRMTLGDRGLACDVLAMFVKQTAQLLAALAATPVDAAALAHTLKGSARAVGAFDVAASASALEAAVRRREDISQSLAELERAVAEARASIEAILAHPSA